MRKKVFTFFFAIVSLFLFTNNVKASFGDLRYEITNFAANPYKGTIKFEGWAFIHKTHNFTGSGVGTDNSIEVYDQNGNQITDGGQKVKITAYNQTTNKIIEAKTGSSSSTKYNFYCQMFHHSDSQTCNEENYKKNDINKCFKGDDELQECYYEDIDFSIEFNADDWLKEGKISDSDEVIFKIAVTNTDYQRKSNSSEAYSEEDIYISENLISNYGSPKTKLEIMKSSVSNQLYFIGIDAILRSLTSNNEYYSSSNDTGYGCIGNEYTIKDYTQGGFSKGYKESVSNIDVYGTNFTFLKGTNTPGMFAIKIQDNGQNPNCYPPGDNATAAVWASWVKPAGGTVFTIIYHGGKKCPVEIPATKPLTCNDSNTYNSDCDELTVRNGNDTAVVKINQTGIVSSILTPNSIYAGGGFKFGIVYYNTISWNYVSGTESSNIESAMKEKLKTLEVFENNIKLTEITFGGKTINDNLIEKKCHQEGEFKEGQTLTTVCTFYLPKSTMDKYTGNVNYGKGTSFGINNKYYTPLNYKGNYNISARITGMNMLTDQSTRDDSSTQGTSWTGAWDDTFKNCSINVYPLLEGPTGLTTTDGKNRFLFIYRPIDLTKPFPNRFPGINWYNWYQKPNNRERLQDSYNNLQYSITIDDKKNADIKKYNKGKSYLDWNTMEGEETFIDKFFNGDGDIKRQNIEEGDN